jgi:hypothetical protein
MGACDISFTIGGKASRSEVETAFKKQREKDAAYNGHQEGYSGDFQTVDRVEYHLDRLFTSHTEALEYCLEKAEKFVHVVAVYYIQVSVEKTPLQVELEEKIVKLKEEQRLLHRFQDKKGFAKCTHCGSRLSKEYLIHKTCRLCDQSLLTRRELDKAERIAAKITNVECLIEKIKAEQRQKALKKNGEKNVKTLVAGWGAC